MGEKNTMDKNNDAGLRIAVGRFEVCPIVGMAA